MPNLIIVAKGAVSVEMPRTRDIQWQDVEVSVEKTMASGLRVKDIKGYRPQLTAKWDYVPAETYLALKSLLRQGGYFSITYPADGTEKTGTFAVEMSPSKVFAFRAGVAVWHDVTLTMDSAEVLT